MSRLDESRTDATLDTYETPGVVLARARYVLDKRGKPSPAQFPCTICLFTSDVPTVARFCTAMGHERFARIAKVIP
jgi:hypothetical protein